MIKVLIADDHTLVREGLKQIISQHSDIAIAGESSNGQEALERIWKGGVDVVLLDISMPGRSGMDILKEIKSTKDCPSVLMLSMHSEEQYAIRALKSGASGYLTKESAPDELVEAIRRVAMGLKYVTASLAEKLASKLVSDHEKPLHEQLSDREYQVMVQLGQGNTVTEIAEKLSLSVKTISTYRTRILEKMNFKNNSELTGQVLKVL